MPAPIDSVVTVPDEGNRPRAAQTAEAGHGSAQPLLQVRAEKIRLLSRQSPGLFLGGSAGALIAAFLLRDALPGSSIALWLALVFTTHIALATLWWRHRYEKSLAEQVSVWSARFTGAVGMAGAAWGAAGILLFTSASLPHQLLLALVIYAAAAASLASTTVYLPAFYACFIPMLAPLTVRLALDADALHMGLALFTLILGITLIFFARNSHRTLHDALLLRHENADLLRELTIRIQQAERANQAKTRFLAAASHDLRQPLHALGLLVGALDERVREPAAQSLIQDIQSSVLALDNLFNGLLDISKLDAGVVTPDVQDFPISVLLARMQADYGPQAEAKGLRFDVAPSAAWVRSDPVLLDRILRNLVANAITYTKSGSVVMECHPSADQLRMEVRDTGIGIPQERLRDIFQEFFQIDNPERDRSKGLGLGLAIVERMAQLLGYRIDVRSIAGKGSVFAVEAPIGNASSDGLAGDRHSTVATEPLAGRFILVVEDDAAVRKGMQELLTGWGCRVLAVDGIVEALDGLDRSAGIPDVIVADYRLRDDVTGIDAIAQVKARMQAGIPAILVSGDTRPESLQLVQASGYPLLHKPVSPAKLRALISHALQQHAR